MFRESVETIVAKLNDLVNTKTVVGDPITAGGFTIIPIVSAYFGFGTGGGEGSDERKCGGKGEGGGGGASIKPTALIVTKDGDLQVYSLAQKGTMEKLAELVPHLIESCHKKEQTE